MRNALLILGMLALVACGKNGKDGSDGADGGTSLGLNGVSTGVDLQDIGPGLACANGGVSIYTFHDDNTDGLLSSGEEVIQVKALCNGLNGSDGVDGADGANGTNGSDGTSSTVTLESIISSATCPNGGVRISSSGSAPVEVCNGINGLNGEQGLPGIQGIPGIAGSNGTNGVDGVDGVNGTNGADGTSVIPVKFCPKDDSTFPEYGLLIGDELFAVFWGTTPASPKSPQAFLTKLVAGKYQSTGGNNCLFEVE